MPSSSIADQAGYYEKVRLPWVYLRKTPKTLEIVSAALGTQNLIRAATAASRKIPE
jgi:hypothetical protein